MCQLPVIPSVFKYKLWLNFFPELQSFGLLKKNQFLIYFVVICFIISESLSMTCFLLCFHKLFKQDKWLKFWKNDLYSVFKYRGSTSYYRGSWDSTLDKMPPFHYPPICSKPPTKRGLRLSITAGHFQWFLPGFGRQRVRLTSLV